MFMNPINYYHTILMNNFINALIEDNNSSYYSLSNVEAIEDILSRHVSFYIDENDTIFEVVEGVQTEIFTKDWKNEDAIYALKILLSEYPNGEIIEE